MRNEKGSFCFTFMFNFSTSLIFVFAEKNKTEEIIPEEITMKEAFKIATKEARNKWDSNAHLVRMTSIDETKKSNQGHNGKRRHWNFMFVVPNTNKFLTMIIHDKKVTFSRPITETFTPEDEVIKDNEIVFDSPEILKKAIGKFKLKPGKDWAVGYHFTLRKLEGKPIIAVVGLDSNNEMKKYDLIVLTEKF